MQETCKKIMYMIEGQLSDLVMLNNNNNTHRIGTWESRAFLLGSVHGR